MKLVSFRRNVAPGMGTAGVGTGVVLNESLVGATSNNIVLDISDWTGNCPMPEDAHAQHLARGTLMPAHGMVRLLQAGEVGMAALRQHVAEAQQDAFTRYRALADLELLAPVPRPGKIIGVGRNYADHAKETGVAPFENPRIIFKMPSSVAAPSQTVRRPAGVTKMDYEAELAVVIGGYGHSVSTESALDLVAGYTVLNDLSAREFQFDISPAQTTFAKSMDGFCPMGPWLVTRDEVPDPQALSVMCWLNGAPVQHGHTADMLFPVATLIAYVSRYMTLEPGDVIATGTPAGIGAFRQPPVYLQPGDRLRVEVSGVGAMEHLIG